MRERYEIETVEQLRAIADTLRIRILDLTEKQPMTATQLGEKLGMATAKVHYHVRELEKVGLLELVETREKGGILEKYYQPIAHSITIDRALLNVPSDEAHEALNTILNQITDGVMSAFRQVAKTHNPAESLLDTGLMISLTHINVTPEEQKTLSKQIYELVKPYEEPRGIEGEREIVHSLLEYPVIRPEQEEAETKNPAKIGYAFIVGSVTYSQADLLKVREENRRLHLTVVGVCV